MRMPAKSAAAVCAVAMWMAGMGLAGFLKKPFDQEQLMTQVRTALGADPGH